MFSPNYTHTSYGDAPAQYTDGHGHLLTGHGVPANGFNEITDNAGVALGLQIHNRATGETYAPVSEHDGAVITENFVLPAGASEGRPDREATDFDFLFGGPLNNGAKYEIDMTSSSGASLHGFLQLNAATGQYDVVSAGPHNTTHVLIGDDAGGPSSAQNSEQGIFFGGAMPVAGSTEDITLTEITTTGLTLAIHDHVTFA